MVVLLLVLGCSRETDRDRYYRASSLEPIEAQVVCQRITDPSLAGECQVESAARAARGGQLDLAQKLCETTEDPVWREECWFQITDEQGLVGADAIESCSKAGRFRSNCLGHAIGREVEGIEKQHGRVGDEVALREAIAESVRRHKASAPESARETMVQRVMAQILSKRWDGGGFDVAKCGAASREDCELAYRMNLDAAPPEVDIRGVCAQGPSLATVAAAHAPPWTPGSEDVALETWKTLCDDLAAGRDVRTMPHQGVPPGGAGTPPPPPPGTFPGEWVPQQGGNP